MDGRSELCAAILPLQVYEECAIADIFLRKYLLRGDDFPAEIYPRLNILDFIDNPELQPQLDLLLQAYLRLQERPTSSPVSYFQLAGIHGQPYQVCLRIFLSPL